MSSDDIDEIGHHDELMKANTEPVPRAQPSDADVHKRTEENRHRYHIYTNIYILVLPNAWAISWQIVGD